MALRVLIVSPIPSHPQDQGNSARIHALGRRLQSAGLLVHFLYCPFEGLTEAQREAMASCWDHFHTVPVTPRDRSPTGEGGTYRLDDWYEPGVTVAALALHRRWRFAAVLVNYVWFSRVLAAFGPDVLKILDTHDVFGGRHERFRAAGLAPEWFYTTEAEEARGLDRADIVLAIQDEEAEQFRRLGHPDVRVLGHAPGLRRREPRARAGEAVTVGYLASGNPLNTSSFARLCAGLPAAGVPGLRLVVAGSICDRLGTATPFEALGRVGHIESFYDSVDLVLNPMSFGTGLKIKSVEALFEGLPLIATEAGMTGLPAKHRLHRLAGPEGVASALQRTRFDPPLLEGLAAASRACAEEYAARVAEAVRDLAGAIEAAARARRPRAA